jgi:Flp pilus assembly protein TadG
MTRFLLRYDRKRDREDTGAQLVEFAFILAPLLVFVVGIVDFGGGYKIYQNITNATREGARLSALPYYNQPTTRPDKLRDRITSYLASLGMETSYYQGTATNISGTTAWTYGNYPDSAYLLIDQAKSFPKLDSSGNPTGMIFTGSQVQLKYPYRYMFFGRVIRLLAPSANYTDSVFIQNSTLIQNE